MIIYVKFCVIFTIDLLEDVLSFLYRYLRETDHTPWPSCFWWIKFSWANFVESLSNYFEFWPPVSGEV